MSFIQIIVLSVAQGITEFLPISSSGHLILGSWLFDWPDQGIFFDVAVHVGTLIAVLIYFRREWIQLVFGLTNNRSVEFGPGSTSVPSRNLLGFIVIAMIPLVVTASFIRESLEENFRTPEAVGWLLIGTSVALLVGEIVGKRTRHIGDLKLPDAVVIGLAQILAAFPGISRSGVTMVVGLTLGMTRESAARFSMMLATPAIAGAGLLFALDSLDATDKPDWVAALLGAVISGITAYFAIAGLMKLLRNGSFRPFIAYCGVVGVAVVIARVAGA